MARYDYVCPHCGHGPEEVEHKISYDGRIFCPKCSLPMTRQISGCSFQLKGRCWAGDGYTRKGQEPRR